MGYSFQGYIDDVVQPTIMETVYTTDLQPMLDIFNTDPYAKGGPNIVKPICVSENYEASNYDRTDVNPSPGYFETAQAHWVRQYQHVAFDVHGIDNSQSKDGGLKQIQSLIQYESNKAFKKLRAKIFENFYARLLADIDDTATFSDAALSRSTYPTLASQVNNTDATITLQLMRDEKFATQLNKDIDEESFIWIIEPIVYKKVMELIGADKTWTINDPVAGQKIAGGYQEAASFDGDRLVKLPGMTVGDMFFLDPMDVYVDQHRGLEIEQVDSGKDSVEFVMRIGMDMWIDQPGTKLKMNNKD